MVRSFTAWCKMVYIRNCKFVFKAVKSAEVPSEIYKDLHPCHWVATGIRTRDQNMISHPIDHCATLYALLSMPSIPTRVFSYPVSQTKKSALASILGFCVHLTRNIQILIVLEPGQYKYRPFIVLEGNRFCACYRPTRLQFPFLQVPNKNRGRRPRA